MADEGSLASVFYHGPIPKAISEAKLGNKILVVYISGPDQDSQYLEQSTWQDSQVIEVIHAGCVALRLPQGSSDAVFFSAIYPIRSTPTISVIGVNGALLQQHESYITAEEFLTSLQRALTSQNAVAAATIFSKGTHSVPMTSTPSCSNVGREIAVSSSSEKMLMEQTECPTNEVCEDGQILENDVQENRKADTINGNTQTEYGIPADAFECEDKEMSPVPTIAAHDGETQNSAHDMLPDRQVVNHSKETTTELQTIGRCKTAGLERTSVNQQVKDRTGPFPLQIRLTNGESIQSQFENISTLEEVKNFVDENRTDGSRPYSLEVPFPRRRFSVDDFARTLKDLELGPRSTLLVVGSKSTAGANSGQFTTSISSSSRAGADSPLAGVTSVVGRVFSYLNPFAYFGSRGSTDVKATEQAPGTITGIRSAVGHGSQLQPGTFPTFASPYSSATQRGSNLSQRKGSGASGNIYSLQHDDDEAFRGGNAYWNGNSTQFGGDNDVDKRD